MKWLFCLLKLIGFKKFAIAIPLPSFHKEMQKKNYPDWWPAMRADIITLIGTPYRFGAESKSGAWPPRFLDCSEFVELVYSRRGIACPDGSWNQHEASYSVEDPRPGDLGFFAKIEEIRPGNPRGIYHVGILYSDDNVAEARAKDKNGNYGELILRPREKWEAYEPFVFAGGWRRIRKLKNT